MGLTLEQWMTMVRSELGLPALDPPLPDVPLLLDLSRDVAHGVARPAAPLTAFLVGLAAGRAGGDGPAVADAVRRVLALLPAPEAPPRVQA
ncbi:MAG TPA: DUF6457 domain-containing protein [Mycobacteriales bacterium]|jgi:hypothetical protein|nr:DUF6457 domain-containing protein [Mycobacteriales bacterium]